MEATEKGSVSVQLAQNTDSDFYSSTVASCS